MYRYLYYSCVVLIFTAYSIMGMESHDSHLERLFEYAAQAEGIGAPGSHLGEPRRGFKEFQAAALMQEKESFVELATVQKRALRQRLATKKFLLHGGNVAFGFCAFLYSYTQDATKQLLRPLPLAYFTTVLFSTKVVLHDLLFAKPSLAVTVAANQLTEHENIKRIHEGIAQLKVDVQVAAAAQLAHIATTEATKRTVDATGVAVDKISGQLGAVTNKLDDVVGQMYSINKRLEGVAQQDELQRIAEVVEGLSKEFPQFKQEIAILIQKSIQEELPKTLLVALRTLQAPRPQNLHGSVMPTARLEAIFKSIVTSS